MQREAFATDEHGKSEPEALATVSKEEAFATDEHGIIRKRRIKTFHRQDAKSAKEDKKSELAYCFLAVLAVLASLR